MLLLAAASRRLHAQAPPARKPPPAGAGDRAGARDGQACCTGACRGEAASRVPAGAVVPADYVIGPEDILTVVFWREKDLSSEVVVRPDGRISLPVLQDVDAAGLTPEQLRDSLTKTAERFVEDPNVTVVVKEINSRRVFITGQVAKPGPYQPHLADDRRPADRRRRRAARIRRCQEHRHHAHRKRQRR